MSKLFKHLNIDSVEEKPEVQPTISDSAEEWRNIPGYEGYYEVSNKGNVRSVDRTVVKSNGAVSLVHGKPTAIARSGSPYLSVTLYKDNKQSTKTVHKLVAQAFIINPEGLPEVDHIDNNPKNNCVENLRWVSAKENTAHRVASRSSCKAKEVYCIDTGETFPSLAAAGRSVQAGTQQVIDSINSGSCCKGKVFVYADSIPADVDAYVANACAKYQNFHPKPKMPTARKVVAVELGKVFNSMADAATYFQCDTATIRNRAKANKPFNGVTLMIVNEC